MREFMYSVIFHCLQPWISISHARIFMKHGNDWVKREQQAIYRGEERNNSSDSLVTNLDA